MARKVIAEFDAIDGPFIGKLRAIDASVARFERGTLTAFGRVEKGVNGILASAARLQNVSGLLAGGLGAGLATGFLDQATRIRRSLLEAGDASQEGFEKAFLAAQRSLSGFESFSQGVQRFAKATGGSFDDSVRQLETLNKLLILGGKSTQERMSTMIQFSQALQANVLQGEELRSLRENAPIELIRAIAEEAGGSIEDLKEFGSQGKLTTEVMIRALQRLEEQADLRIKNVTLTISEAAVQFANAGIVAAEGFDRGLGLSRTTVAGLTALGKVLGESADAAEAFGKALQIALVAGIGAYAGGRLNTAIASTRDYSLALREAAKSADAEVVSSQRALTAARNRATAAASVVDRLVLQGAAQARLEKANNAYARSLSVRTAAEARATAAIIASDLAQKRLLLSTRALAASGALLRSAFLFLGGWPGIILAAGLAFLTLRANVESAAERFQRLTQDTGEATNAADRLRDVQARLNEAIEASGKASDDASKRIIANTEKELKAKRDLFALELQDLERLNAERQKEIELLRAQERDLFAGAQANVDAMQLSGFVDDGQVAQIFAEADAAASGLRDKVTELAANFDLTNQFIEEGNALLAQTARSAGEASGSILSMVPGLEGLATSAKAFADELLNAANNADGVASADMASGVKAAGDEAKSLAAWLGEAYNRALAIATQAAAANARLSEMKFEFSPGGQALLKFGGRGAKAGDRPITDGRGFVLEGGSFVNPNAAAGGGGGGGGRARQNELDEEALSLIESMMTAEERRAKQIKEAIDLREQLVQKYGAESQIVAQVDQAIQRMNDGLREGQSLQEEFWKTMSDEIASNIEDWKGWGGFLRSLLASFVRQYGPEFFEAIFTPGKQSGGGLGTLFGNLLTGQLHGGGTENSRSPRYVSPSAFIGAPRFHNGLASDEFTAILQKGETVLPKGMKLGGGGMSIQMNNDFRGVDNASREYIEGRLSQMQKELPDRVVAAVKDGQRRRQF